MVPRTLEDHFALGTIDTSDVVHVYRLLGAFLLKQPPFTGIPELTAYARRAPWYKVPENDAALAALVLPWSEPHHLEAVHRILVNFYLHAPIIALDESLPPAFLGYCQQHRTMLHRAVARVHTIAFDNPSCAAALDEARARIEHVGAPFDQGECRDNSRSSREPRAQPCI